MELIGLSRAATIRNGDKWRVTWSSSLLGDVGQLFSWGDGGTLHAQAEKIFAKLFETGWAVAASQPAVNTQADAFTIDVRFSAGAARMTVATALQRLDDMLPGLELSRVAAVSTNETSAAGARDRDTVTTNAAGSTGAGAVVGTVASAAAGPLAFLGNTAQLLLLFGAFMLLTGRASLPALPKRRR